MMLMQSAPPRQKRQVPSLRDGEPLVAAKLQDPSK
ncbi:msr3733 [Mesorhizobium japonicum MAFF 303099]|uniref:Msr3733 protein n=1 Tax=Mesorhizobium japonicum (strain LMG 29417 / CECT 9101 / MAFF 303099) TaxID=266835 RepID=Q98FK5_RHILO|nr:msr3733 [Mesorhizobium japonicum MAFF 303099]